MTAERLAEIRDHLARSITQPQDAKCIGELVAYISDLQTMAAADQETIQKLQASIAGYVQENKLLRAVAEAGEAARCHVAPQPHHPNSMVVWQSLCLALKAYREHKEKL